MTISLYREAEYRFDFDAEALYISVVNTVLDEEECPYDAEVSLLLTDDASIKEINKEQRGIDAVTDVLSFPMVQYDSPGDFSIADEAEDCFNIETGELMLGDIVISVDRLIAQADEYGHSIRREYAFLIVHSMLHLIGYDHIKEADRLLMEVKQKKIMKRLDILR